MSLIIINEVKGDLAYSSNMRKKTVFHSYLLCILFTNMILLSKAKADFFVGSSAFMLANLDSEDEEPPRFYQLNFGYRFERSSFSFEYVTWRYYEPIGIPFGDEKNKEENNFPGYVKAQGLGIAYQYFTSKNVYLAVHVQWMNQEYRDEQNNLLGKGKQLFFTGRLGYQFKFFKEKLFLEPNVAITHWPINTNLPESFQQQEDKWSNYFIFEPGLHIGFNF